ncbi:glycosyltransferase family 2 protein [Euzebya tangerina]|uniref:glycosyltransferase family 2 protein n=1 Tax=Euzebya tangerina TaxID=591198 RepID=UPI0013C2ACA4|nr:glycosyltransferase family 2 protein [Euzebya tangerina]
MSTPSSLSCVVPVYDEVESLPAFHASLCAALDDLTRLPEREIIYVDDGSTDGSTGLLEEFQQVDPARVRVVVLRRNFGKSGALAAGFEAATGDLIVTLDADGQDVPGEIGTLVDTLIERDVDLVGGWRAHRIDRSVKRRTSQMYNAVTRLVTGLDLHDFNTGFKLMRREVVEELPLYGEFHRFVPVLAYDLGFRVDEVPVEHRPREAGTSKFLSLTRFPKTMLDLLTVLFLTRFADRPLYLFGGVGAVFSILGVLILGYLSYLRLVLDEGIGTRPLLLFGILLLLVGVQLIGTGFIGDVLRHTAARHQQPFRVRRSLGVERVDEADRGSGSSTQHRNHDSRRVDGRPSIESTLPGEEATRAT